MAALAAGRRGWASTPGCTPRPRWRGLEKALTARQIALRPVANPIDANMGRPTGARHGAGTDLARALRPGRSAEEKLAQIAAALTEAAGGGGGRARMRR